MSDHLLRHQGAENLRINEQKLHTGPTVLRVLLAAGGTLVKKFSQKKVTTHVKTSPESKANCTRFPIEDE